MLVGERTPTEYLEHLDRRRVEHLTAGVEQVDAPALRLVESEVLDDGALWLVYATTSASQPVH